MQTTGNHGLTENGGRSPRSVVRGPSPVPLRRVATGAERGANGWALDLQDVPERAGASSPALVSGPQRPGSARIPGLPAKLGGCSGCWASLRRPQRAQKGPYSPSVRPKRSLWPVGSPRSPVPRQRGAPRVWSCRVIDFLVRAPGHTDGQPSGVRRGESRGPKGCEVGGSCGGLVAGRVGRSARAGFGVRFKGRWALVPPGGWHPEWVGDGEAVWDSGGRGPRRYTSTLIGAL